MLQRVPIIFYSQNFHSDMLSGSWVGTIRQYARASHGPVASGLRLTKTAGNIVFGPLFLWLHEQFAGLAELNQLSQQHECRVL